MCLTKLHWSISSLFQYLIFQQNLKGRKRQAEEKCIQIFIGKLHQKKDLFVFLQKNEGDMSQTCPYIHVRFTCCLWNKATQPAPQIEQSVRARAKRMITAQLTNSSNLMVYPCPYLWTLTKQVYGKAQNVYGRRAWNSAIRIITKYLYQIFSTEFPFLIKSKITDKKNSISLILLSTIYDNCYSHWFSN